MTKVVIIIGIEGQYENVYADSEVNIEVLKRGEDDRKIDVTEQELEEVIP